MTAPIDKAATALVLLAIGSACLYPETFISGDFALGSQRITPLTMMLPLVSAGTVVYLARERRHLRLRPVDAALIAFMSWLVIRNPWDYSALAASKYVILGAGIYYLIALLTRLRSFSRTLMISLLGLAGLIAAYGLLEFTLQRNIIFGSHLELALANVHMKVYRIGSTLGHPVALGAFLVQIAPFTFLAAYWEDSPRRRWLGIVSATLVMLALLLTFSKASLLVAGVPALAALTYHALRGERRMVVRILIPLALIAAAAVIFWQPFSSDVSRRTNASILSREVGWTAAIASSRDHLLAGVGIKNGIADINGYIDRTVYVRAPANVPIDNYYLKLAVEEGIIGLGLWLVFLFLLFRDGFHTFSKGIRFGGLAGASLASAICISLNALSFDAMYMYGNYVFFWMAAGLLRGIQELPENQEVALAQESGVKSVEAAVI